ncbi:hypothetical protein L2A60_16010 [Acidiphilium iwatense]|uniref:Uncharacterized protein n=2 Tax=Acidiphilium iwatense TaxID=768198 RepID=A0ABS9DZJ5_9PROT|nr:hypothetical protein [Acidiphilium iwatense]
MGVATRAPLLLWMIDHHDEMRALIQRHRINWAFVTERFTQAGFRAAGDRPLKPRTVRGYWERARKYVEKHPPAAPVALRQEAVAPAPASAPLPGNRRGFVDIEPEIAPDDLFDKPLPTIRLRHQQPKSAVVTDAERTTNDARASLSAAAARSAAPLKPKE